MSCYNIIRKATFIFENNTLIMENLIKNKMLPKETVDHLWEFIYNIVLFYFFLKDIASLK